MSVFTNEDSNVFCLKNLDEVTKAAMFSRYSRTHKGARELWDTEFNMNVDYVDTPPTSERADDFFRKVFVAYGDESVAEMASAHIAFENISSLAADFLTDTRIGISPIEKSGRYMAFTEKVDGRWPAYNPWPEYIEISREYESYMDYLFTAYNNLLHLTSEWLRQTKTREQGTSDRAWDASIRAQACDMVKNILPAARYTTVGLHGNARAFGNLLEKGYVNYLTEVNNLTHQAHKELNLVLSPLLDRVRTNAPSPHYNRLWKEISNKPVVLRHMSNAIRNRDLNVEQYIGDREGNRRNKIGRAFEDIQLQFSFCAPYAVYRDFHRHRLTSQSRCMLTFDLGYSVPEELPEHLRDVYAETMQKAQSISTYLRNHSTDSVLEYLVPRSYKVKWMMSMSLREAAYIIELRSGRQGHPDYRRIAWAMYDELHQVLPSIAQHIMVDRTEYSLTREKG